MKDKIVVVHKETLSGTKLDEPLSQELIDIGKKLNIGIRLGALPFGGSDAVPFARKKVPATSFMSFVMPKLPYYYHTKYDSPEVVDKDSIGQVLQICLEYIKKQDNS
jgi:putative aminopeptidase FrvX